MAMQTTAIRFGAEEKEWIQAYADFTGRSFSDVVREAALEAVEDAADLYAYNEALVEDTGERFTLAEVISKAEK